MEIRSVYIRGNPYYNGNMSETYFMLWGLWQLQNIYNFFKIVQK